MRLGFTGNDDALLAQNFFSSISDLQNKFSVSFDIILGAQLIYLAARLEGQRTSTAGKTLLMVGVAHRLNNLALNILLTSGTLCSIQLLIVSRAIVGIVLGEESTGC